MKFRAFFFAALTLAGCGRSAETAAPETAAPPAPATEIAATDQLGPFDARINAVAFWNHPSIPFNGLVLAATASGLLAFNIEDGVEVARIADIDVRGVDVAYAGQGAGAQGYAVLDVGGNASDKGLRLYAIDNATRALTLLPLMFIADGEEGRGFCLGRTPSGEIAVYQMTARGVSMRPLAITESAVTSGDASTIPFKGGFVACAGDRLDGAVFAVTAAGDIYRIDADGKAGIFAKSGVANPAGIGIALNGLVEGGDTAQCCGQVAVLNGADGSVHLFDREDGRAIGVVRIASSFDVEGVGAATALGLGSGNFGAVYRDGALALATNGDAAAIRMTPLNAVMDGLSLPLGLAASLRDLNPQPEEETLDFSLEPPPNP